MLIHSLVNEKKSYNATENEDFNQGTCDSKLETL